MVQRSLHLLLGPLLALGVETLPWWSTRKAADRCLWGLWLLPPGRALSLAEVRAGKHRGATFTLFTKLVFRILYKFFRFIEIHSYIDVLYMIDFDIIYIIDILLYVIYCIFI